MNVRAEVDWSWLAQLEPLAREVASLADRGGRVAALTVMVPAVVLQTQEAEVRTHVLQQLALHDVRPVDLILVANGGPLRVLSVEFEP